MRRDALGDPRSLRRAACVSSSPASRARHAAWVTRVPTRAMATGGNNMDTERRKANARAVRAVPVWMTFGCGLGLAAGGTGALAALGAGGGDDGVDDGTRRLVLAAGCFHGLGVGMVKVAVLPAMSQLVEDRHGSMFGVGLGVQGFATKLAGGAIGMVGLSFLIESVGFTRALSFFAMALAAAALAAGWFARGIKLRVEATRDTP